MNSEEKPSLFSPRSQKKKKVTLNLLMFREIPCIGFAFFLISLTATPGNPTEPQNNSRSEQAPKTQRKWNDFL